MEGGGRGTEGGGVKIVLPLLRPSLPFFLEVQEAVENISDGDHSAKLECPC